MLLLVGGEAVGGNHSDLLFFVELLIELGVLLGNLLDEHQALVLCEDLDEADGHLVEVTGLAQTCVEGADLLATDTGILCELLEAFTVCVELSNEFHVFEYIVKSSLLGGGCEEDGCIAPWDGILLGRGLVIRSRLNLLNVTESEWLEVRSIKSGCGIILLLGVCDLST